MIYALLLSRGRASLQREPSLYLAWDLLHAAKLPHRAPVCALSGPGWIILCAAEDVEIWEPLLPSAPLRFALVLHRKSWRARRRFNTRIRWDLMQAAGFQDHTPTLALAWPGAIVICCESEYSDWEARLDEFSLQVAVRSLPVPLAAVGAATWEQEERRI
jgi:hypothetical protein